MAEIDKLRRLTMKDGRWIVEERSASHGRVRRSAVTTSQWSQPDQFFDDEQLDLEHPVFILSCARSGSTLLRFILDTHPELACSPETDFGSACAFLARMWSALQGLDPRGPQILTAEGRDGIRRTVDEAVASYLQRHGKRRWCEKSLDTVVNADLIAQVWPDAQFICLTRHCMDVIYSAVEATPWGLAGYGFNAYAARTPTNSVAALGDYWLERTRAIVGFQQSHPDRSFLLRYEDLVDGPEETIRQLFGFLGVSQVPGITQACFQVGHEAGPGDEKIWLSTGVHGDSVGRGRDVPVKLMPQRMRDIVNTVLEELRYEPVTEDWNNLIGRPAGRVLRSSASYDTNAAFDMPQVTPERIQQAADRWPQLSGRHVGVAIRTSDGGIDEMNWLIGQPRPEQQNAAGASNDVVRIAGDQAAWRSVLTGEDNLVAACVSGRLTVTANGSNSWLDVADEGHAIAFLLGLEPVPVVRSQLSVAVAAERRALRTT